MVDYIVECSIMDGKRKVMFYEKNNPRMTYEELDKTPWSKDIQRELKFLSKLFEMRIKGDKNNLEHFFQRIGNFPYSRDPVDFAKNGLDGIDVKYKTIIYDLLLIGQNTNIQKMNKCSYLKETVYKDYIEFP